MNQDHLESKLKTIRHLLSHLQGELSGLETEYTTMLRGLRRLEVEKQTDDLTGLLRKQAFQDKLSTLLSSSKNVGVLMIDIDFFKHINDNHGHPTGDEVIKRVAALLKQFASPQCVAGRVGGEEFAIAMAGTEAEIIGTAEFIRRGAERMHGPVIGPDGQPQNGVVWKCTLSIGVTSTAREGADPVKLMASSDAALYQAKKNGRNQVKAA